MKRIIKRVGKVLIIMLFIIIIVIGSYIGYVAINYYRIEDDYDLTSEIENNIIGVVNLDTEYTITTYNIGFGAYSQDYSFFLDSGKMLNDEEVVGKYSTAFSKEAVLTNTIGAISEIKKTNADFSFFQEVDVKGTRSYKINQYQMIKDEFSNSSSILGVNFHSAYLAYPFNDPHGMNNAGIVTLSKYQMISATRYSLIVDDSFPNKFFDLDRCYTVTKIKVENEKELVLVNVHLSAYDEGGKIREKQWNQLNIFLNSEYEKGNYIVVGGDFNHDIANSDGLFPSQQYRPEWVFSLTNEDFIKPEWFSFATSINAPTCRSSDIPYVKGVNYSVVIDGFIISDNVLKVAVENIDTDFLYSDHNPVKMIFKLK